MLRNAEAADCAWSTWSPTGLVAVATAEGVLPLVAQAAAAAGDACPAETRAACAAAFRRHVAAELVREQELRRVVAALASAGVSALLMKGADLAYNIYRSPDLRMRTDSDVLVSPGARNEATRVLRSLGYSPVPQTGGDLLMYQEPFRLSRDEAEVHVVDLHWRIFNPHVYGNRLSFEELEAECEPRLALAPQARGLNRVHALVLACVHRIAHHFDHARLIWLYDVHLLAGVLTPGDWQRLEELARDRQLEVPCRRTLDAARAHLATAVPADVLKALHRAAPGRDDAAFLNGQTPHAFRVLSDFRHLDSWRGRARLARQHLFPPAAYMRGVYAPGSSAPLWTLYVNRIVRGTRRWIARS